MLYVLLLPEHTEVVPDISLGCAVTVPTVILNVLEVLEPQLLFATTLSTPLVVGVKLQLVVVPLGEPVPL